MKTTYSNRSLGQINRNREFARGIAPHVLAETVEINSTEDIIKAGKNYWLQSQKFAGRYYVAYRKDGKWYTSAKDERVAAGLVARVYAYELKRQAA